MQKTMSSLKFFLEIVIQSVQNKKIQQRQFFSRSG